MFQNKRKSVRKMIIEDIYKIKGYVYFIKYTSSNDRLFISASHEFPILARLFLDSTPNLYKYLS